MKALNFILIFWIVFNSYCKAQLTYPKPEQNFYNWMAEEEVKLDTERTLINNDEIFFGEGGDYKHYKQYCRLWEPIVFPHGVLSTNDQRLKTYYGVHPFSGGNTIFANTDEWEELGPKQVPPVHTYASQIGPTEFINFYKSNPQYMLTASNVGGLFFSDNGGANWVNAGSDTKWGRTDCDWADFHPTNPNYWFASSSNYLFAMGGMHRKPGIGSQWELIGDYMDFGYWTLIQNFIIDPVNPDNIYTATSDGLYKSTNALTTTPTDVTWLKCNFPIPAIVDNYFVGLGYTTDPNYRFCNDVEFKPQQAAYNVIYASIKFKATLANFPDKFVYAYFISTDAGGTWNLMPNHPAISDFSDCNIEVSNSYPDFVYCLSYRSHSPYTQGLGTSHLLRFKISTSQWVSITTTINPSFGNGESFGVDQQNGNIYISSDVGFSKFTYNSASDSYTAGPANQSSTHDDIEDIIGNPSTADEIWIANHGGVCKSTNGGASWSDQSTGIGVSQPMHSAFSDNDPSYILTGLNHDGSLITRTTYSTSNWNPVWGSIGGGDGDECLIDNQDDNYMYASAVGGSWYRTENKFTSGNSSIQNYSAPWDNPGILNKSNPKTLYRLIKNPSTNKPEITRSFDKGKSGTNFVVSNFAQLLLTIHPLLVDYTVWALYTPYNAPNIILAHVVSKNTTNPGWDHNHLFRCSFAIDPNTNNVINSWVELPLPINHWLGEIAFDPINANILYLPFSSSNPNAFDPNGQKMLFRVDFTNPSLHTYDQCNTNPALCQDLTYNLPNVNAAGFTLEKGTDGGMYIGTSVGVFYTNNKLIANGTNWNLFGTVLPNIPPLALDINYTANKIRATLPGRGFWQHNLHCPQDINRTETIAYLSNQFIEAENYIYSTSTVNNQLNVKYRAGNAIELNPGFIADYGSNFMAFLHPCSHSGNSFRSFVNFEQENDFDSTEKVNGKETIKLFPNPADDFFTIKLEGDDILEWIELQDLSGKVIKKDRIINSDFKILTKNIASGLYFLIAKTRTDNFYSKILIQHR